MNNGGGTAGYGKSMASMAKVNRVWYFSTLFRTESGGESLDTGDDTPVFPWYFAIGMVFSKVLPYLLPYPGSLDITGFLLTEYGDYGKYGKNSLSLLSGVKNNNDDNKGEVKNSAILAIPAMDHHHQRGQRAPPAS